MRRANNNTETMSIPPVLSDAINECRMESAQYEFDFSANASDTPSFENEAPGNDGIFSEAEPDLDMSSPLYGNKDENVDDWKSVDVRIDIDSVLAEAQDRMQSDDGGKGAPPQDNPNASSDDKDAGTERSPEHSRSNAEFMPAAQNTRYSEQSERSEQSETPSFNDWKDSRWISPIYPSGMRETLMVRGCPYSTRKHKDGTETISKLNECFFAGFVILNQNLHYHNGSWYGYSESTGTWQPLNKVTLRILVNNVFIQFGEKMQIAQIEDYLSLHFVDSVIGYMGPFPGYENIFDHAPWRVINVKNGTITISKDGSIAFHEHAPEFLCRSMIDINYDPAADYSSFVSEAFGSYVSQPDAFVVQQYAGQCILKRNVSQTFLVISGASGTGKSQIAKVIERVVGSDSCEGLRTGMLRERFELSRFDGKSLLLAVDECSEALMRKGADMLKALTGGDTLTTEVKGQNEHPKIIGVFNVILVSNPDLALNIDDDRVAWTRRMRVVKYVGEEPKNRIDDFAGYLLVKYPEAVLNWMVTGAAALMQCGGRILPHPEMSRRIDEIIQLSDAFYAFVKNRVVHTGSSDDALFCFALYEAFVKSSYFVGKASKRDIQTKLKQAMKDVYGIENPRHDLKDSNGKLRYGYLGFRLELNEPE